MRRLKIVHTTRYEFGGWVQLNPHRLLLRPREGHELRIESSALDITPPPAALRWLRDVHDNSVAIASFSGQATRLSVHSEVIVQHYGEAPLDFLVDNGAVNHPFHYDADSLPLLRPYLSDPQAEWQHALHDWLGGRWGMGAPIQTYTLLERLCLDIHRTLRYEARQEPGVQMAAETLQRGAGSCRDFANLFMEAARTLGIAARFVSGYLEAPQSFGGATHAWAEVYLPGAGWRGFDPTLGELVGAKHVAVAVARRPDAVSPVAGSFFGSPGASLHVHVSVSALQT